MPRPSSTELQRTSVGEVGGVRITGLIFVGFTGQKDVAGIVAEGGVVLSA